MIPSSAVRKWVRSVFNQSLLFWVGSTLSPYSQHSSRYRAPFRINHLFNVPRAVNDQRYCPRVSLSKQLALARFSKSLSKFPSIVQFYLFCFIQNEKESLSLSPYFRGELTNRRRSLWIIDHDDDLRSVDFILIDFQVFCFTSFTLRKRRIF